MKEGAPLVQVLTAVAGSKLSLGERFEGFLRDEREALFKFLLTRLSSEEDAQDAVQESLIRMIRYRDTEPPQAWKRLLYRIAVNVANDQHRHARSRHVTEHVTDDALDGVPADAPDHDDQLVQREALDTVIEVILTLSPRCQEIFLLNRVQGMTYVQVADTCGISIKAVEKHMANALAALRRQLGKPGLFTS